jgi:hypothetical protein
MNSPLRVPPVTVHVDWVTGVPEIEHKVSVLRKPEPDTCTFCAGLAEEGMNVIVGGPMFSAKFADAESPF